MCISLVHIFFGIWWHWMHGFVTSSGMSSCDYVCVCFLSFSLIFIQDVAQLTWHRCFSFEKFQWIWISIRLWFDDDIDIRCVNTWTCFPLFLWRDGVRKDDDGDVDDVKSECISRFEILWFVFRLCRWRLEFATRDVASNDAPSTDALPRNLKIVFWWIFKWC